IVTTNQYKAGTVSISASSPFRRDRAGERDDGRPDPRPANDRRRAPDPGARRRLESGRASVGRRGELAGAPESPAFLTGRLGTGSMALLVRDATTRPSAPDLPEQPADLPGAGQRHRALRAPGEAARRVPAGHRDHRRRARPRGPALPARRPDG